MQKRPLLFISILILIAALLLGGCSAAAQTQDNDIPDSEIERAQAVTTPLEEVSSANEVNTRLSIDMTVPPQSQSVKYYILRETIAQSTFLIDSMDMTFRMSRTSEDISGVYVDFSSTSSFTYDKGDTDLEIQISINDGAEALATWYAADLGIGYSLYCPLCSDLQAFSHVAELMAAAN